VTVGQDTSSKWEEYSIGFVPQGVASNNIESYIYALNNGIHGYNLLSGQVITLNLPVAAPNQPIGSTVSGTIWAVYDLPGPYPVGGTVLFYHTQMAAVTLKAV